MQEKEMGVRQKKLSNLLQTNLETRIGCSSPVNYCAAHFCGSEGLLYDPRSASLWRPAGQVSGSAEQTLACHAKECIHHYAAGTKYISHEIIQHFPL